MRLLYLTLLFQLTTSSLKSKIEFNNIPLSNKELILIHKPTNYKYFTKTNKKGEFEFDNLDVGGPYKLIINIDKKEYMREYKFLSLGDNEVKNIIIYF